MRSQPISLVGHITAVSVLILALSSGAFAQGNPSNAGGAASGPGARSQAVGKMTVNQAVARIGRRTNVLVVADSTVGFERIASTVVGDEPATTSLPPVTPAAPASDTEKQAEKEIETLVAALPAGTTWGKLYLPAPPTGRTWKGDDVAAFAFAQARLFGTVGVPRTDGSIEILGKPVDKEAAPGYISRLGLVTVYLVTNPKRQQFLFGGNAWSAASEDQWTKMTPEERKAYGKEQAAWIMNLPPEQRDQVLERIRQHDAYFESVKGPLEKLLGYDL